MKIIETKETAKHRYCIFTHEGQIYSYANPKGWAVESFAPLKEPNFNSEYTGNVQLFPPCSHEELEEIRGCFSRPETVIL